MEELSRSNSQTAAVHTDVVVFDGQTEQGVELDYVLPDYCPDIFKILKCSLIPRVISYNVSVDSKLMLDGVVYIKVLYLAENSNAVHCIDQRYTYSKTVDMGKRETPADNVTVSIIPKTDYCNCRAVNSRRIDVRGAVSCRIRAIGSATYFLPQIPDGLQARTKEISCCGKTLSAQKQFTVREEIETGASGIGFIAQCDAVPKITDLRVIADKAVLKGTVTIDALYGIHDPESSGCTEMEKMTADIPVSAILDINGITDTHLTLPELSVMNCELAARTDSGLISCELLMECRVRAQSEETSVITTDVYSTDFETEFTVAPLKISTVPRVASKQLSMRSTLSCDSGEIRSVWDCRSELGSVMCRPKSESELSLTAQLSCQAIGKTTDGIPFFIEKQETFEQDIPAAHVTQDTSTDFSIAVTDTGFAIKSDGALEITASIDFSGSLHNIKTIDAINAVTVREDKPKDKSEEFALRICYIGEDTADCWSVAKRYNTTVEALMRENEIEDEQTALSGMVLIPTV